MNNRICKSAFAVLALLTFGTATADLGVGIKAGTLGLGVEGRWKAVPWLDFRLGINGYDYDDSGTEAGIDYDGTLSLDSVYATGNLHFPLSPFRLTAGVVSNGNELKLTSQDFGESSIEIGNGTFDAADVGTLRSVTSFDSTAPYLGVGFDFEVFGKVGLNLDLGVLWQGEPSVTLEATGLDSAAPDIQDELAAELENERLELEDELSDLKAWPVISLGFVYNF